jgi:hypothetical protein
VRKAAGLEKKNWGERSVSLVDRKIQRKLKDVRTCLVSTVGLRVVRPMGAQQDLHRVHGNALAVALTARVAMKARRPHRPRGYIAGLPTALCTKGVPWHGRLTSRNLKLRCFPLSWDRICTGLMVALCNNCGQSPVVYRTWAGQAFGLVDKQQCLIAIPH